MYLNLRSILIYSIVSIVTCFWLDGPGIESQLGARYSVSPQTGPKVHPASCTMGTGFFPRLKWLGHGADHPPLLALGLQVGWSRTSSLFPCVGMSSDDLYLFTSCMCVCLHCLGATLEVAICLTVSFF